MHDRSSITPTSLPGGNLKLAEGLTVTRVGYGAMQLAGPGVWGPPRNREQAIAVLREAVQLVAQQIDTSGYSVLTPSTRSFVKRCTPTRTACTSSYTGSSATRCAGSLPRAISDHEWRASDARTRRREVEQDAATVDGPPHAVPPLSSCERRRETGTDSRYAEVASDRFQAMGRVHRLPPFTVLASRLHA